MIHLLRRNMDLNVMLFNNRIYGLTKGQYSPTSELGKVTRSTPMGSLDRPFNPLALALGSGATFVCRTIDIETKHLQAIISRSYSHKGTAFIEIYQNCKADKVLWLENGQPMLFGSKQNKGIRLDGNKPIVVTIGKKWSVDDLLVHDEEDYVIASLLSNMTHQDDFPDPIGVLYAIDAPTYEDLMLDQIDKAVKQKGIGSVQDLLDAGDTWVVK